MIRGNRAALSLAVVGTAAAVGYALRRARSKEVTGRTSATIGARTVDAVPEAATVVGADEAVLNEIPGVRRAISRARETDDREEWGQITLDHEDAWTVVDRLREGVPYYQGVAQNGVYISDGETTFVVDAVGWARIERPPR